MTRDDMEAMPVVLGLPFVVLLAFTFELYEAGWLAEGILITAAVSVTIGLVYAWLCLRKPTHKNAR